MPKKTRLPLEELTQEHLRAWRAHVGLTQEGAAIVAGVRRLAWARWETDAAPIPQWLCDVLRQRQGSAPDEAPFD